MLDTRAPRKVKGFEYLNHRKSFSWRFYPAGQQTMSGTNLQKACFLQVHGSQNYLFWATNLILQAVSSNLQKSLPPRITLGFKEIRWYLKITGLVFLK